MSIYLFTMWLNQKQTVWFTGDLVDVKKLRAVERALGRTSRHVKSYRCLERVQLLDRPPHAHTYIHTHTTGWDQQLKAFQQAPPSPLSQAELSCSRVTLSWLCPHHKTPSPSCTPVLLVCNGAWWQMRSFDTQTKIQEQANKKKKNKKHWVHSFFSASVLTLSCGAVHAIWARALGHARRTGVWPDISFLSPGCTI